jgi:hypothetical protein
MPDNEMPSGRFNGSNGVSPPSDGSYTNGGIKEAPLNSKNESDKAFLEEDDLLNIPATKANPESDCSTEYLTDISTPEVDESFVESVKNSPDADRRVKEKAASEFQGANPICQDNLDRKEDHLNGEIKGYKEEEKEAVLRRQDEPAFEEVATTDPKKDNAYFPFLMFWALAAVLIGGVGMMSATIASFITQSDKIPIAYEHPYIAVLFAFLPLSTMIVIAQAYDWIGTERHRKFYLWSLCGLVAAVFIGWLVTLGPAYAQSSAGIDDLAAAAPFDFFALHISIQLCGEVLMGGLLKISLHILDRSYRKTEIVETTQRKCYRAHITQIKALCAPSLAELDALTKYRAAYDAALSNHRENYVALLEKKRLEQREREEAVDLAGVAASAAYQFDLIK